MQVIMTLCEWRYLGILLSLGTSHGWINLNCRMKATKWYVKRRPTTLAGFSETIFTLVIIHLKKRLLYYFDGRKTRLFKSNSKQFLKLYRIKITFVNVADSFSLRSNFKLRIGGRIKDKWVYQLLLGDYINISTYGFLIKSRGPMLKLMDPMSSAIKLIKHLVHEKRYVWLISKKVYLIGHVKYVQSFLYRNPVTNLQIAFSYLSDEWL